MSKSLRLAVIGSLRDPNLLRSSHLISDLLRIATNTDFISDKISIDIFTQERVRSADINVFHLHQLPAALEVNNYDILLYNLENRPEAFLYRWYASQYPGLVVLHDRSIFRLEMGALLHGTDPGEINRRIQEAYGDRSMLVGDQHVRGKSLEVYGELYSFLYELSESSVALLSFSLNTFIAEKSLACPDIYIEKSNNKKGSERISDEVAKNFLVYLESPFSFLAEKINERTGSPKANDKYPRYYYLAWDHGEGTIKKLEKLEAPDSIESVGDVLVRANALVISGLRPYNSTPGIARVALERGVRTFFDSNENTSISELSLEGGKCEELNYDEILACDSAVCEQILSIIFQYRSQSKRALDESRRKRADAIDVILRAQKKRWEFVEKSIDESIFGVNDSSCNRIDMIQNELFKVERI